MTTSVRFFFFLLFFNVPTNVDAGDGGEGGRGRGGGGVLTNTVG